MERRAELANQSLLQISYFLIAGAKVVTFFLFASKVSKKNRIILCFLSNRINHQWILFQNRLSFLY